MQYLLAAPIALIEPSASNTLFYYANNIGSPVLPKYLRRPHHLSGAMTSHLLFYFYFYLFFNLFLKGSQMLPSVTTQWSFLCVCNFCITIFFIPSCTHFHNKLVVSYPPLRFYELFVIEKNKNIHFVIKMEAPCFQSTCAPPKPLGAQ